LIAVLDDDLIINCTKKIANTNPITPNDINVNTMTDTAFLMMYDWDNICYRDHKYERDDVRQWHHNII